MDPIYYIAKRSQRVLKVTFFLILLLCSFWAVSSEVERFVDTEEVRGSIPLSPTISFLFPFLEIGIIF